MHRCTSWFHPSTTKRHGIPSIAQSSCPIFLDFLIPWYEVFRYSTRRQYGSFATRTIQAEAADREEGKTVEERRGSFVRLPSPHKSALPEKTLSRTTETASTLPRCRPAPSSLSSSPAQQSFPSGARRKPSTTTMETSEPSTSVPPSPTWQVPLVKNTGPVGPQPASSFIHHHISRYNPPSPRTLLTHLKARPELMTIQATEVLANYSRRHDEPRIEREMKGVVGRLRIQPARPLREGEARGQDGRERFKEVVNDYLSRPNQRAMKAYPPRHTVSPGYTSSELLGHLHQSLVRPTTESLRLKLEEALEAINELHRSGKREFRHEDVAREALHLYLAYPTPTDDVWSLISDFLRWHPSARVTKQTLHLVLLAGASSIPSSPVVEVGFEPASEVEGETPSSDGVRLPGATVRPNIPEDDSPHPLNIVDFFQVRYDVTPGLETYRHLACWAHRSDAIEVAEIAWKGWWAEHTRLRSLVQAGEDAQVARTFGTSAHNNPLPLPAAGAGLRPSRGPPPGRNRTQSVRPVYPAAVIEVTTSGISPLQASEREHEMPQARFRHLGQHFLRWRNQVMSKFRDKGWVERVTEGQEELEDERVRWVWRGRAGESRALKRRQARWEEREERRKEEGMEIASSGGEKECADPTQ